MYENNISESVLTLRSWVLKESELQTVDSETVHGVNGCITDTSSAQRVNRYRSPRTFFGDQTDNHSLKNLQKSVSERWNIAKRLQLCYPCFAEGHAGKFCQRSRVCGENGCLEVHHRLLHRQENKQYLRPAATSTTLNLNGNIDLTKTGSSSTKRTVSVTEGNEHTNQTTMTLRDNSTADYLALPTVPVILTNGSRSVKVNALLDDASTKTYTNSDVAAELGVQGTTEKVTVNVINGQVKTFETSPIEIELKSMNGYLNTKITAFTANQVTGNMPTFEWSQCTKQ